MQGTTVLWLLARAAANGYPEPLQIILNKLSGTAVQKLNLEARAETGKLQDITVLLILASAVAEGYPAPLQIILNKLSKSNSAIPVLKVNAKVEKGSDKCITVLWELARAAARRKSLDLNAAAGSNKAQTVLVMLAFALANGYNEILRTIMADCKEKISSLILNDVLQDINWQGTTLLLALSYAAISGCPIALEIMLDTLPSSDVRQLDLTAAAKTPKVGCWQGKTVLWLLLENKIANPSSTELDKIIELLINKQGINAHNLNAAITMGESKSKTVLWLLVDAAANGYPAPLEKIVSKLENKEVQMLKLSPDVPKKYMEILGKIKNAYLTPSILFKFKNLMQNLYFRNLRNQQNTQQNSKNIINNGKGQYNCSVC